MKKYMPNSKKVKRLERITAFLQELEGLTDQSVSREEVRAVLDAVIAHIKEMRAHMDKKEAENRAVISMGVARIGKECAEMEKRMRKHAEDCMEGRTTLFDNSMNEMWKDIAVLEDLTKDYPEVRAMCVKMQESMPKQYDETNLLNAIEALKGRIEEVNEKVVRGKGGGGLSDRALQYAMGRMIKTETPSGDINGVNTDYTVTGTIQAVLGFMLNGEAIALSNYSIVGTRRSTIRFTTALPAAYSGKDFEIIYI